MYLQKNTNKNVLTYNSHLVFLHIRTINKYDLLRNPVVYYNEVARIIIKKQKNKLLQNN